VGNLPSGVTVNQASGTVYVSCSGDGTVWVIKPTSTESPFFVVPVGKLPAGAGLRVANGGVYVANEVGRHRLDNLRTMRDMITTIRPSTAEDGIRGHPLWLLPDAPLVAGRRTSGLTKAAPQPSRSTITPRSQHRWAPADGIPRESSKLHPHVEPDNAACHLPHGPTTLVQSFP